MATSVKHSILNSNDLMSAQAHQARPTRLFNTLIAASLLIFLLISGTLVHRSFWNHDTREENDIYYHWVEGGRLLTGENPYERVLAGDMRTNDKYATLFPGFYFLSAATRAAGLDDYDRWIAFWRGALLAFNLGAITIVFVTFWRRGMILGGFFAALILLFNRYSMNATESASIDFIPLFFLILSLVLVRRNIWLALLLLSLSLAVKQVGIILVPLYLIFTWQSLPSAKLRGTILAAALIGSIPLLFSLPFLAWNAEGYIKSLLFSATREAMSSAGIFAVDAALGLTGVAARLPMLAMMLLGYLLLIKRDVEFYTAGMLTMAVFVLFNSVLFSHYMNWFVPLIVLAALDYVNTRRAVAAQAGT